MTEPTRDAQPLPEPSRHGAAAVFLLVTAVSVTSCYLWFYSDCLGRFFFLDDFWELKEAERISIHSPFDLWQFLRPVPFFLLYRPVSTLVYFYAMRQLFEHDPTAYHATQLAFNVVNAVLVYAIAGLLFRSRPLGLATALAYAAAPGHMLASCWNASFTMTGTAFFYFVGLWTWLRIGPRWRAPMTTAVFVTALLASEHALTFPVSLTLIACLVQGRRDWRGLAREQAVFYAIAMVYACVKLVYIRLLFAGVITGPAAFAAGTAYALHLDPLLVLHNLGKYLGCALSPLYARSEQEAWGLAFGAIHVGVALATTTLVVTRRWTAVPLRVATLGIDLFAVALGPTLLLRGHLVSYYVGIAGLGSSLAVVAMARAIPRVSTLAVPLVVAVLLLTHAYSTSILVRKRDGLFFGGSEMAERWLYAVTRSVRSRLVQEVVLPTDPNTLHVFEVGEAHRILACARYRVRLSERIAAEQDHPWSVVVRRAWLGPLPSARDDRWGWLRAACARQRDWAPP